jgi:hypothetical protein
VLRNGQPMRAGVVHASSDLLREFAPSGLAPAAALTTVPADAPAAPPGAALVSAAAVPTDALATAAAAAPSAALVPTAVPTRAALVAAASEALVPAKKGKKEEAVDGVLCSTFQGVEAGKALAAVQSLCDPLDHSSLSSARNAFYFAETGIQLMSHGNAPSGALWPGGCERPPDGYKVLVPGFKNKGVETTLRKQWWLRVAVALAVCIRKGRRMAMRRCMIKSGANKDDLALIMCAPRPPQPPCAYLLAC